MASLKLLIVEDDLPSLELMAEVFTSLEASVRPVSDSRKAAALVNEEKFDGIFLDLEMPNLHGLELTQMVRQSSWNKTTPVVIVTGREDRETMRAAFSTGATFFLQKPVDRRKLIGLFRGVRGTLFENRRRSARVPIQTDVVCTVGAREFHGQSWNLSQGGMQVEVSNLEVGNSVKVSFRLPSSNVQIDALGTVVWTKQARQGIRFTKVTPQNDTGIREYIAQVEAPD
jgi:CheY-like chemotaxis protein